MLVLGRWLFLTVILVFDSKWGVEYGLAETRARFKENTLLKSLLGMAFVCVLVSCIHSLMNPAFLLGVDRFEYNSVYVTGLWKTLDTLSVYLILIAAMSACVYKSKLGFATLVIYCIYLFCIGTKFGAFFSLLALLLIVFYPKIWEISRNRLRSMILLIVIASLALIGFASFANGLMFKSQSDNYLTERASQQGQLWNRMCANYEPGEGFNTFEDEIYAAIYQLEDNDSKVGANFGIYKIMYLTAPDWRVDSKLSHGSRYTEAGYASAFYYFGIPGVLLYSVIMGLFAALLVNSLIRSIVTSRTIKTLLIYRLYIIYQTALSMFIFSPFFDLISLLTWAYLILDHLLTVNKKNKKVVKQNPYLSSLVKGWIFT